MAAQARRKASEVGWHLLSAIRVQRPIAHAVGELPVHRPIERDQPVPGAGLQAGIMADDFLGVSVKHDHEVDPAEALDHDLGHIDAPPLVRRGRPGLGRVGLASGAEHQEVGRLHDTVDPLLVGDQAVDVAKVGPDPAVAPERMLGLEVADALEQLGVALDDLA
jgi:hypothetical protein